MTNKSTPDEDPVEKKSGEREPVQAASSLEDLFLEVLKKGRLDLKGAGLLAHLVFNDKLADSNCDCIVRCGCVSKCGGCRDVERPEEQERGQARVPARQPGSSPGTVP